eukprot:4419544-Lingulodinium_polyedra.AAC.1
MWLATVEHYWLAAARVQDRRLFVGRAQGVCLLWAKARHRPTAGVPWKDAWASWWAKVAATSRQFEVALGKPDRAKRRAWCST